MGADPPRVAEETRRTPRGRDGLAAPRAATSRSDRLFAVTVYVVMRLILGARLWSPAWIVLALLPSVAAVIWVV